jgi:TolB-like protein/Tfp pilus assembly protein PilF
MKRCPQCNRVETDDSLAFCRTDGAALVSDSLPSGNEAGTARLDSNSTEAHTSILPQATAANVSRTTGPTTVLHPPATSTGTRALKRIWIAIALVVFVTAAIVAFFYFKRADTGAIDSIAVLPFVNKSNDVDSEYLSDGLTESLIYRLSQLPNLKVSPTSSVLRYKGKEVDPHKIAAELSVSAVLSGRMVQRGDNLTISVELIDARNSKLLWGEQYERKMSDLLATQRQIAREIVDNLKLKVSGEEKGLAKHYTESNEAYQLYLRGRFYWNKRSEEAMLKSLEYFQEAIHKDPSFALAYSGLADSYILLGAPDAAGGIPPAEALPKAQTAALKALELDDTLAEAHASLAHAKYYDRELTATEQEYKRAIELNPNYPTAHSWYAVYLMSLGRFDEALVQIRRAQELDPLSLPINMTMGWVLLTARRPEESVQQLRKTLEMDSNFSLAHHRLGLAYEQQGKYEEAIAEFKQVVTLTGGKPLGLAALGRAYALAGRRTEAQKTLVELQEVSKERYVSPAAVAAIYAALGDNDRAFNWLDKAQKEHDGLLVRLKVDARYDSLRSDPRFEELLKRAGLPD